MQDSGKWNHLKPAPLAKTQFQAFSPRQVEPEQEHKWQKNVGRKPEGKIKIKQTVPPKQQHRVFVEGFQLLHDEGAKVRWNAVR